MADKPRIPAPIYSAIRTQAHREGVDFGAAVGRAAAQIDAEDREMRIRVQAMQLADASQDKGYREGVKVGRERGYVEGFRDGEATRPPLWVALVLLVATVVFFVAGVAS